MGRGGAFGYSVKCTVFISRNAQYGIGLLRSYQRASNVYHDLSGRKVKRDALGAWEGGNKRGTYVPAQCTAGPSGRLVVRAFTDAI